jgi:perosamine synthetase
MSADEPGGPRHRSGAIPIAGPWITEREVEAVAEAARSSWYAHAYDVITEFETRFADYADRRFAIAMPSCTAGIHLALAALGVGPGDEVVVPESTWIATSAPVSHLGATPRFVDVDPITWCLDVDGCAAVLNSQTKAVVAVDLYGGMPDMAALTALCAEQGVALIEDAAEAVGSELGGRRAGGFGDVSVFSFHGTKTLTTHEGGMVLTDDEHLVDRMLRLRDQGRAPGAGGDLWNLELGYKYRMSAMQAAMGVVQLDRVDELVGRKREIFGWYRDRLADVDGLTLNAEPDGLYNSYWMSTVVLDEALGMTNDVVIGMLCDAGATARPFFHPLSSLPAYQGFPGTTDAQTQHPVSYGLGRYGVNLPSALNLDEGDVDSVCRSLVEMLGPSPHSTRSVERGA